MSKWIPAFFLATITAVPLAAQGDSHACQPPRDLDRIYRQEIRDNAQDVENARKRLALDPENFFLNRWYLNSLDTSPGATVEEYQKKLSQHPDDAVYLYFYGRALTGLRTPEAIDYLQRSIARDPDMPWAYDALRQIYGSPKFRDPAKLGDATLSLTKLCPDNLDAFAYLYLIDNLEVVRELAVKLRVAVERRSTSGVPASYPTLWAAEFRVAGPEHAAEMRQRVAADLPRVIQLNPENYKAHLEAYKLLGDTAKVTGLQEKLKLSPARPNPYRTIDGWLNAHPFLGSAASPEEKARAAREELDVSAQWVRDWPEEPHAWYWRFLLVARQPQTTNEEVDKLGQQLVEVVHRHPVRWSTGPEVLEVAKEWNRRGIRLADCITLAAEAVEILLRVPASENDLYGNGSLKTSTLRGLFSAYDIEVEAAIKLKDFTRAASVIGQMKSWLDRNPTDDPQGFQMYNLAKARVADSQGHTMDALAFYQRTIQTGNLDDEVIARARSLWERQGGSNEAFEAWLTRTPDPHLSADWWDPASRWIRTDQPLDGLHASDLTGHLWTAADFKGKTTFIAAWATWCGACIRELVAVDQLYALTKGRTDVQVVTFNIDDKPELIAPYLKEHHLTVPVIPAKDFVKILMPETALPHSWIVDSTARVKRESAGFDPRVTNWPQDLFDQLAAAADKSK